MNVDGIQHGFRFHPNWGHLEDFLQIYKEIDRLGKRITIKVTADPEFDAVLPGYPNIKRNAWLTLDYAIQQINRVFNRGKSLVDCKVIRQPGGKIE